MPSEQSNHARSNACFPPFPSLQVNIDGSALPIKKLKGTDPVESIDLSGKNLGPASAVVIASLIGDNGALTALTLSYNKLEDEGISAICKGVQSNKESKLISLDLTRNYCGPAGAKSVAAMVAVVASLTAADLRNNDLDKAAKRALRAAVKKRKKGAARLKLELD